MKIMRRVLSAVITAALAGVLCTASVSALPLGDSGVVDDPFPVSDGSEITLPLSEERNIKVTLSELGELTGDGSLEFYAYGLADAEAEYYFNQLFQTDGQYLFEISVRGLNSGTKEDVGIPKYTVTSDEGFDSVFQVDRSGTIFELPCEVKDNSISFYSPCNVMLMLARNATVLEDVTISTIDDEPIGPPEPIVSQETEKPSPASKPDRTDVSPGSSSAPVDPSSPSTPVKPSSPGGAASTGDSSAAAACAAAVVGAGALCAAMTARKMKKTKE